MAILDHNTLANRAFTLAGMGSVSFNDESDQAALALALTEATCDSCLSRQNWSFATRPRELQRAGEIVNKTGYAYAFNLPGGRLSDPLRLLSDGDDAESLVRDFRLDDGLLFANHEKLWMSCIWRTDPDLWPPLFVQAVTFLLASHFALSVQKADLATEFRVIAVGTPQQNGLGGLMGQMAALDAASTVNRSPLWSNDPLNDARLS